MYQLFALQQARARAQNHHSESSSGATMSQSRSRASVHSRSSRGSVDAGSNPLQAWWDERRVSETVTEAFLHKSIGDESLREKLNKPIMENLSDTTFAEWILWKARRLLLLLLEMGETAKIFELVESSWDDTDLPLEPEQVAKLGLKDISIEKRFLRRQYAFLVRDLDRGAHVDYDAYETIPLEAVKSGLSVSSSNDKFIFPRTQQIVIRKSIPLGKAESEVEFHETIRELKEFTHHHIVGLYASYTFQDEGFLLFAPAAELTLKSFFQTPPAIYKSLSTEGKRRQMFDWMHCLSDAVRFLHEKGIVHRDIRPKSILIDGSTIFLADAGVSQRVEAGNKPSSSPAKPNYEYAAPELYKRSVTKQESARNVVFSGRAIARRGSHETTMTTAAPDMRVVDWVQSTQSQIQYSDIFSLACIFLEILTFLQGKQSPKDFASHRAAKNRRGARGARGALADQSFHANLEQVGTWIAGMKREADQKGDINVQRAINLCAEMLFKEPTQRPEPRIIMDRLFVMVEEECHPNVPHCINESYRADRIFSFAGEWGSTVDEMLHTPVTDYSGSPGKASNGFAWFHADSK
ncbi:hypothetical protein DRE_00045 [Drechslerella stenobrocha 248]|uniref:Protein kinase domain-containing protein n=1 Tax=Drechslerella stenobrocha 248 TaxID=1043628 RepID=W7IHL2_9PEZI|nr:hypothetical protein DRE_00045 [Drechslerella stenobrocha 248]